MSDLILCLDTRALEQRLPQGTTFRFDTHTDALRDLTLTPAGRDARAYLPEGEALLLGSPYTPVGVWVLPHNGGQYLVDDSPARMLGHRRHIGVHHHRAALTEMARGVATGLCYSEWEIGHGLAVDRLTYRGLYTPHPYRLDLLYTLDLTEQYTGGRARREHYGWEDQLLRDQNVLLEVHTRDVAQRLIDGHPGLPKLNPAPRRY